MRSKFFGLLVCLAALGIGTGSCRHEADEVCNPTTMLIAKPSDQFKVMWELIDKGYVFFADDATDWDAVYRDFYPQFVELDSCDIIPSAKLQELYSKATETLIDHHMTIQVTNYWAPAEERDKAQGNPTVVVNPASVHLKQRPDYHPALTAAQRNTLFEDTYTAMEANGTMTHRMTGLNNMFLTYARIDGDIVYLQFNTFLIAMELCYGTGHHQSYTNARGEVIPVNYSPTDAFKAYLADLRRADIKGIVIDVRENGGGDLSDLGLLVGTLINEETTVGYTRTKQGLGRLDLSPWTPLVVSPHELSKGTRKDVPVVMLVNLYSASMAEIPPMSMRCREDIRSQRPALERGGTHCHLRHPSLQHGQVGRLLLIDMRAQGHPRRDTRGRGYNARPRGGRRHRQGAPGSRPPDRGGNKIYKEQMNGSYAPFALGVNEWELCAFRAGSK